MSSRFEAKLSSSGGFRVRSEVDIVASILREAQEGAGKTRIMYRCNLSYRQLQRYLKLLLGLRLLRSVSKKGSGKADCFETSVKGLAFLDAYRTLKALMV